MKKINIIPLLSILLCSLTNCQNKNEYITFSEYVDIVTNSNDGEKDIFIFTATNCPHCKKIEKPLEKYIKENNDINIYKLCVDTESNTFSKTIFKDETMGVVSGNIVDDNIKRLDNRIGLFLNKTNTKTDINSSIIYAISGNYSYVLTPLILWYDSGIEVKIANNVEYDLESDDKGNIIYDSFSKMMNYPETYPNFSEPFSL